MTGRVARRADIAHRGQMSAPERIAGASHQLTVVRGFVVRSSEHYRAGGRPSAKANVDTHMQPT